MFNDSQKSQDPKINRREFLAGSIGSASAIIAHNNQSSFGNSRNRKSIHTVLGSIDPYRAGVILTHEHAPTVDWSEYTKQNLPLLPLKKYWKQQAHSLIFSIMYSVNWINRERLWKLLQSGWVAILTSWFNWLE